MVIIFQKEKLGHFIENNNTDEFHTISLRMSFAISSDLSIFIHVFSFCSTTLLLPITMDVI